VQLEAVPESSLLTVTMKLAALTLTVIVLGALLL
jgi:hypothetical protein